MILNLLEDESGVFAGKKLLAEGSESLSFIDIDNMLKQTYTNPDRGLTETNSLLRNLSDQLQLFFHGNSHATNFKFFLDFVQVRNPQFADFENAGKLLGVNLKSFREYYVQKAEKFDDRISITEEDPTDFRYPSLQNYYKISLN